MSKRASPEGGAGFWWSVPPAIGFWALLLPWVAGVLRPAPAPPAPVTVTEQLVTLPAATPAPEPPPTPTPTPRPEPVVKPKPKAKPKSEPKPKPKPEPRPKPAPPTPRHTPPPPPRARADVARPAVSQEPPSPTTPAAPARPLAGDQSAARALFHPLPEIPDSLRMAVVRVVAVARFEIAPDGSTTVTLVRATPDPRINRVILRTLRRWRFFPAMRDGQPRASVQQLRLDLEVK